MDVYEILNINENKETQNNDNKTYIKNNKNNFNYLVSLYKNQYNNIWETYYTNYLEQKNNIGETRVSANEVFELLESSCLK